MKDYPYITIILLEFWFNMREQLLEEDLFIITSITECDGVYNVRFIKESWSGGERMLDLPIKYYKQRLNHYKSLERDNKLKQLGL